MFNAKDDDFAEIFHGRGTGRGRCPGVRTTRQPGRRARASPRGVARRSDAVVRNSITGCGYRLGQLPGQGTARWRGEGEFVVTVVLAGHWRSWRAA